MSDMANYNAAATTQGAAAMANTALQGTNNILQSSFNTKKTKELAKYQNEMNIENWDRQNEYNEKMALNYNSQIMRSARNAGLNPVAAMAGPHFAQTVGSIPSAGLDTSSGNMSPMDLSYYHSMFKDAAETIKSRAEAKKAEAEAGKIESETTGVDLNNEFLSSTLLSRIDVTNEENKKLQNIASTVNSNPELIKSYAESQKFINEKLKSDTDLNSVIAEMDKANTNLLNEKQKTEVQQQFVLQTQGYLNQGQLKYVQDDNLRKNRDNVGWISSEMQKYTHQFVNGEISSDECISRLNVLQACLEHNSTVSQDVRRYRYQSQLQSEKIQAVSDLSRQGYSQNKDLQNNQLWNNVIYNYTTLPRDIIIKLVPGGSGTPSVPSGMATADDVYRTLGAWSLLGY